MSETASTIIKLLSSLVSPKTCIKYLTVACSLVFSWVYVGEFLKDLEKRGISVSSEQSDIIILLVGVGIGGLLGFMIVGVVDLVQNKFTSIQQDRVQKKEAKKSRIEKEKSNESFLNEFIDAIGHLRKSQIRVLRLLTKGRANIDFIEGEYADLAKNKYIHRVSCVYSSTYITEINPLLKDYVIEHWKSDVNVRIDVLYEENPFANELLELLESENSNSNSFVDTKWFQYLSVYGRTCLHGDYERNPSDIDKADYELWFGEHDEDIMEELARRNNTKYNGNLVISNSRLKNSA